MLKPETVKIEDSNIASYGGADHDTQKTKGASSEDAWKGAGVKVGVTVWRIEKFQVVRWPRNQYGKFFSGDSYIILSTYKPDPNNEKLAHDLHFWIGSKSSQDEKGTAAYKTVELDDYVRLVAKTGDPLQHRETEGHESDKFTKYWGAPMQIMSGGIDSGFNTVKPKEYKPRLLQLKGRKNIRVMEVDFKASSLNSGDVFILDAGLKLYQWNGTRSHPNERRKGAEVVGAIRDDRLGKPAKYVYDESDVDPEFWDLLGGSKNDVKTAEEGGDDKSVQIAMKRPKSLHHVSDASGRMEFKKIAEGDKIKKSMLDSNDAFIVDCVSELVIWVGSGANPAERAAAMKLADQYMADNKLPDYFPVTRVMEGQEKQASAIFRAVMGF